MKRKILFVDDEQNILDGIRRQLCRRFPIETALGAVEGLQAVKKNGPFAVVVADLRMPVMDGIKFLIRIKQQAPETVRMILTGNADMASAIKAVNDGHVFRFMTKPCATEELVKVLESGIEQYQLVLAKRELLEQTLNGSIKVLTEILSMLNPEAFSRASRVKRLAVEIAYNDFGVSAPWKMETAALLSQIGLMTLPGDSLEKLYHGDSLTPEEKALYDRHPQIGFELLKHIPQLEDIAEIIRWQEEPADTGETAVPIESQILNAALDFDLCLAREGDQEAALMRLKEKREKYAPEVLEALEKNLSGRKTYELQEVSIDELRPKMIVKEDIKTFDGLLLVAKGQELGPWFIERLRNHKQLGRKIPEPVQVLIPN